MAGYLIPGLGEWIRGNKEKIEAPWRERYQAQAQGLLGVPEVIENANYLGMEPDQGAGQLGAGDVQTQAATGLMQDPNDFYNQMQFGLGLMGTPGYEGAGQAYGQQALGHALGYGERQQSQQNWYAEQMQRHQQNNVQAAQAAATAARAQNVADANQTGALYDDAQALLKGPRQAINLFDNVQTTVRNKGFAGMNITDDTVMAKTLAKLILPDEAVMEGDIGALMTMEGIPSALRSIAGKLSLGVALTADERKSLYDQSWQLGQQKMQLYQQGRDDFTERAQRRGFNPKDVLNTSINADMTNMNIGNTGKITDQVLKKKVIDQANAEQRTNDPNFMQQLGDWWAQ